jgi:hypothetical protein
VQLATDALDVGDLALDQVGLGPLARLVLELPQNEGDPEIRQLPADDSSAKHIGVLSNVAARPDER